MAKKKSITMDFRWDNDDAMAVVQRLGFGAETNEFFAKSLVKYATPYTPFDANTTTKHDAKGTSHLRGTNDGSYNSGYPKIEGTRYQGTITYENSPHANRQYNLPDETKRATPDTHSEWLEYAWTVEKQRITGAVGGHISAKSRYKK